jgi:hypothetical protein
MSSLSWYVVDGTLHEREAANRRKVMRSFVDSGGHIERLPAKENKRLIVLDYVAQAFEIGRKYPERDVNRILVGFHDDFASLRRYLVDAGFLEREHGVYWRSGGTVVV